MRHAVEEEKEQCEGPAPVVDVCFDLENLLDLNLLLMREVFEIISDLQGIIFNDLFNTRNIF